MPEEQQLWGQCGQSWTARRKEEEMTPASTETSLVRRDKGIHSKKAGKPVGDSEDFLYVNFLGDLKFCTAFGQRYVSISVTRLAINRLKMETW